MYGDLVVVLIPRYEGKGNPIQQPTVGRRIAYVPGYRSASFPAVCQRNAATCP